MTHQDLTDLVDYHYWARDRLLAAIEPLTDEQLTRHVGGSFGTVRDTLVHIYGAEWAWLQRWQGQSPAGLPGRDSLDGVAAIREAWSRLERQVRGHLAGLDAAGLEAIVEYRLFSGQPGASRFRHMLQHVVNHASYHRGQVVALLRELGAAPPKSLDLIAFYREPPDGRPRHP
jgi:uncharacterized damage-inducible protein DinB